MTDLARFSSYQSADQLQYVLSGRHPFTQAMRARTLREELQHRLQHLADLLYDVTRGPDDPEQVEVVAIASAVEHLRAAVEAIEHATSGEVRSNPERGPELTRCV